MVRQKKEQLIKDKKIKKEKTLAPISEDEMPFDIPNNWKMVYLGELFMHNAGKALNSSNTKGKLKKYITTSNVYWDHFELDNLKEMYYTEDEIEKYSVKYGDLLILEGGDVGRTAIWNLQESYCIQNHIHRLRPYVNLNVQFYYFVMYLNKQRNLIEGKGIGIKGLSSNKLHQIIVPLPPIEEQQRIVDKLNQIMPLIDEYEKLENQLVELKKKFPEDMKTAILQAAMEGKLTEQLESDSNVFELLKSIQQEKDQLIKEKKIKKEKPLPPITEEEIPFDIPDNWRWCKLGEIVTVLGGKRIPAGRKLTNQNTGHIYIRVSDMKNDSIDCSNLMYVPDDIISQIKAYTIGKNDVYITVAGTIGRVGKIPIDLDGANLTENANKLVIYNLVQDWLIYSLKSNCLQKQIVECTTKVGQPKLAIMRIQNFKIPLPPIEEQQRIVDKLNQLLPLVNQLNEVAN